jgi:hypothetical protein
MNVEDLDLGDVVYAAKTLLMTFNAWWRRR